MRLNKNLVLGGFEDDRGKFISVSQKDLERTDQSLLDKLKAKLEAAIKGRHEAGWQK
jgi:hypothetical protein